MRCGHCKETGVTVEHVRSCAGQPARHANDEPSQQDAPWPVRSEPRQAGKNARTEWPFPPGHYAIRGLDEDQPNRVRFFKVDKPERGKWVGWTFLKEQAGSDLYPVKGDRYARVMEAISEDPPTSMRLYGQELGICGLCGRELTDEESRAYGVGPVCRNKAQF